jgi:DNA-directed RNA polymerase alpha subunit
VIPLHELHLLPRTEQTLRDLGFVSAEHLARHRPAELLLMHGIGRNTVDHIVAALKPRGLALRPDAPRPGRRK